jgi:hypothetical protein
MATKEVHSSGDNFSRCVRVAFAGRAVGGEGRLLAIWKRSVKGGGANLTRYRVARILLSQLTSVATSLSSSSPFLSSSIVRSITCCGCASNSLREIEHGR